MVVDLPEPVTPARMTMPWSKLHSFSIDGGRPSFCEGRDVVVDAAGDQAQVAALLEEVDAEAALVVADDVGEVGPAGLFEDLPLLAAS